MQIATLKPALHPRARPEPKTFQNHSTTMTKQEISVFEAYEESIVTVAVKLRKAYAESLRLSAADAPDFYQTVLREAPTALLEHYKHSWEDEDAIRAFLYRYFFNRIRDARKQAWREQRYETTRKVDERLVEEVGFSYTFDACEDSGTMAKLVLDELMSQLTPEEAELCKAFMEKNSWAAAGEHLGWSNGKLYRVQSKLKNFFQQNCKKSGEFFEVAPKR